MNEKRVFIGGMDSDTDDRLVAQGDYRKAINLRVVSSEANNVGSAVNVVGNEVVVNIALPSGINKCIGVHRSEQRDSVFFFVWSSIGQHGIYEYSHTTDAITTVLQNNILNFGERSLITGTSDLEGLLYWTDDLNPPRKVNIEKAKLHTASQGTDPNGYGIDLISGDTLVREKYINAIKAQPEYAPTIDYFTDPTRNSNRVRGKFLRFRYRYVYDDNEVSAWSEPSVLGYNAYDFLENSNVFNAANSVYNIAQVQRLLNGVSIGMNTSHETVVAVEVSVASGYNDFFLWRRFEKDDLGVGNFADFTVSYFGDSVLTPLDINDSVKPFDDLPQLAKAQALIEGNKLAYGNYVTGYDPVDIDVRMSVNLKDLPSQVGAIATNIPFGEGIDFTLFGSTFIEGGQVNDYALSPFTPNRDMYWHGRRWDISAQQFKDLLIASGVEVLFNSFVEIDYGLGTFNSPYSVAEPNLGSLYVAVPPQETAGYEDPYFFLYDQLQQNYVVPWVGEYEGVEVTSLTGSEQYTLTVDGVGQTATLFGIRSAMVNVLSGNTTTFGTITSLIDDSAQPKFRFFDFFNMSDTEAMGFPPFTASTWENGAWPYEGVPTLAFSRGVVTLRARCIPVENALNTTFKSGATHSFGLVYYDAYGRSGFANVSGASQVYVPSIPERNIPVGSFEDLVAHIRWRINHAPPSWATHYAWVYAGNDRTDDFLWLPTWLPNTADGNTLGFISPNQSNVRLSLKRLSQFQDDNPNVQVSYDFSQGDRISFLSKPATATAPTNNWRSSLPEDNLDLPILTGETNGTTYIITVPRFDTTITNDSSVDFVNSIVEIYKPKLQAETEQRIYYTISEKFAIVNGQHSVTQGEFTRGDCYIKQRVYNLPSSVFGSGAGETPTVFYVESPIINDNIPSRFYDRGKPYTVDNNQGQTRYIDQVTYSAPFVVGSKINGLSNFNPVEQPFKEYGRIYGAIQRLFAFENRMEVYQEDKVQYSMVSRDVIYNNQGGGSVVGTLSETLSDPVGYLGEYGICNNPESWAQYGSRRYFVDKKRGVVLRLSQDGLQPISDVKMITYFRDRLDRVLRNNPDGQIHGVFDPRHAEYIVSVEDRQTVTGEVVFSNILSPFDPLIAVQFPTNPNITTQSFEFFYEGVDGGTYSIEIIDWSVIENPDGTFTVTGRPRVQAKVEALVGGFTFYYVFSAETVAFSENSKRWSSFYSFEPEFMGRVFNDICTFKDGRMYIHNRGARNTFYGVYTPSEVWFVCNAEPSQKKFYKAIGIEGNAVFVPYEITTPEGQQTSLVASDFEAKEGYFYAEILRDEFTPSETEEGAFLPNALFEGDRMRDYALIIKARNEDTGRAEVFAFNVFFEVSFLQA